MRKGRMERRKVVDLKLYFWVEFGEEGEGGRKISKAKGGQEQI